jgi:transposase-like protein
MVRELHQADPKDSGVIARVARQLGVGPESLRIWITRAEIEEGKRPGMTDVERAELTSLRKEVRRARCAHRLSSPAGNLYQFFFPCRGNEQHGSR